MAMNPIPHCDEHLRDSAIRQAERAAQALNASLAEKPDEKPIETDVRSLRGLSGVIGGLLGEVDRCGGVDCMGRALDGRRLWVTKDRFDAEKARADHAQACLDAILDAVRVDESRFGMLIDWQSIVTRVERIAQAGSGPTTTEFVARNHC